MSRTCDKIKSDQVCNFIQCFVKPNLNLCYIANYPKFINMQNSFTFLPSRWYFLQMLLSFLWKATYVQFNTEHFKWIYSSTLLSEEMQWQKTEMNGTSVYEQNVDPSIFFYFSSSFLLKRQVILDIPVSLLGSEFVQTLPISSILSSEHERETWQRLCCIPPSLCSSQK